MLACYSSTISKIITNVEGRTVIFVIFSLPIVQYIYLLFCVAVLSNSAASGTEMMLTPASWQQKYLQS